MKLPRCPLCAVLKTKLTPMYSSVYVEAEIEIATEAC